MTKIKLSYCFLILAIFMGQNTEAQDWAKLGKYQAENAKLETTGTSNSIVFMGDSITEFWTTNDSDFFTGKPYTNRGISGQTTPQMLVRFRADVIALKPKVVLILAGINDIAGNTGPSTLEMIMNNIYSMVELAKANKIKVILCSVLPADDFPWKPNQNPADKVINLNKMIKEYAKANKIEYVDYFSAMVNDKKGLISDYSGDGVHPNKVGYQVMGPLAEKAIQNVLSKK